MVKPKKAKRRAPVERPKAKKSTRSVPTKVDGESTRFPLAKLHLDGKNPRLGNQAGTFKNEVKILDAVVNGFGIDDVLSSLAVNGYFEAEPLVGVRAGRNGDLRIAEGNRRLAACLILIGDDRARNHEKRTTEYQTLQRKYKQPPITEVPVRVLSDDKTLLSYLGVRHIAAAQPWDSFAKAAWVAKVLESGDLDLEDVSDMIGDQHKTVARTLEGFYFVNQLIEASQFNPSDSLRPGRGSNPEYPFSWIYTALGYGSIREWLCLDDLGQKGCEKKPIKSGPPLDDAGELLVFLFGSKSKNRQPAVNDSRNISDLAKSVANLDARTMLKRGKSVQEVADLLKPAKERVADNLLDAQEALTPAQTPLSQGEVGRQEAGGLLEPSRRVRSSAVDVNNKIIGITQADQG